MAVLDDSLKGAQQCFASCAMSALVAVLCFLLSPGVGDMYGEVSYLRRLHESSSLVS